MADYRPLARRDGLVVREVQAEMVVYDLERHHACSLNRVATLVYRLADGRARVPEIAERLRAETAAPLDESAVWLALERLAEARLLATPLPGREPGGLSRRECLRSLARSGIQAALLPAVASILAPTPADAASVLRPNDCKNLPPGACRGQPCSNGKRCFYDPSRGRCRCG
jgi:hypothetical protein